MGNTAKVKVFLFPKDQTQLTMKEKIVVFTIIAKNYYPQAAIFAESYKKYHPDHDIFVFYVDNYCIHSSNFRSVPIKKVNNIKKLSKLSFKYNITEFSTAVKPYIFLWLFKNQKASKILYFDPDICFYKRADKIVNELDKHDCIIIPHRTKPTNDKKKPNEWDFMGCGYYNLGFVGFRNSIKSKIFIKWWSEKLDNYAYSDIRNLMFTDQKWMDFAPCFLDTYILRDRGYDVAYWNLHEYLNTVPIDQLYFFHFSGFVPERNILSKHQNRFSLDNIQEYKKLFNNYSKKIAYYSNRHKSLQNYVYPFDKFSNDVKITQQIREIYRYIIANNPRHFSSLYKTTSKSSFFSYLTKIVDVSKNIKILNLFLLLNKSHDEIYKEFPLDLPYKESTVRAYISWLSSFGKTIYNIPDFFVLSQKKLTKCLFNTKFNSKIPINYLDAIFSLEKLKKTTNNHDFVTNTYKIILHRNPDPEGYQKNLKDLDYSKISRNFFILRLFSSPEFYNKHGHPLSVLLYSYYLFLLVLSTKFFLQNCLFAKNKNSHPKKSTFFQKNENTPGLSNNTNFSYDGWNIAGYFDTESGVGASARGLVKAFDNGKIPININNIEQQWLRRQDKTYTNRFTTKSNFDINLICVNADQLKPVIDNQLGIDYIKNKYNIGYWYWESNIFPDSYYHSFDAVNEIWTATTFVQQAISLKSPKPVICIPPALSSFNQRQIQSFDFEKYGISLSKNDFVFLNIFDSASFWQRKNPFGLINAFTKAFKGKKGVKLIIKTTQIRKSDIYKKIKEKLNENKQIYLIDTYLNYQNYVSLLNSCDCYVGLHRAEGLGIPLIDAHFLGKPVIATNFSGNVDFENQSNSFLVDYKPYILAEPIGPYPPGSAWADPDINQAAYLMKKVKQMDSLSLKKICHKAKADIIFHFSPERIAKLINSRSPIINKTF